MNEPKVLDFNLTEAKAKTVDGLRQQQAIENVKPHKNITNTITVDETKDIAKQESKEVEDRLREDIFVDLNDYSKVHEYALGTELTTAILGEVKSGDIIKVGDYEFVVNNNATDSPRKITGKQLGATSSTSFTAQVLNWTYGNNLALSTNTLDISDKQEELTPTTVQDGSLAKVLGFDSQGSVIKAVAPEGTVVVDGALSDTSENAIQNKAVYEAITNAKNKITQSHFDIISELNYQNKQLVGYTSGHDADFLAVGSGLNYNTYEIDLTTVNYEKIICKLPNGTNTGVTLYYTDFTSRSQSPVAPSQLNNGSTLSYITYDTNVFILNIKSLKNANYKKLYICYKKDENAYIYAYYIKPEWFVDVLTKENIILTGFNIFNSIGACGDSYTAGSMKHSNGTWTAEREHSYIATIGKRAGINWSNYGVAGATTRSYLSTGLPGALAADANDFYFLCFGINDAGNLGADYLGTISDIKTDYTQNEDTFYGNYGKIISRLMLHNPSAKLCLIKIPLTGATYEPFTEAIENIANHFNIPFIDPYDDIFFTSNIYLSMNDGHPTLAGYVGMGLAFERLFSKCYEKNIEYFRYSTVG